MSWNVYFVRCNDDSLYCGITAGPVHFRVDEHNNRSRGAKYCKSRRPVTLVWSCTTRDRSEALRLEAYIKSLRKPTKERIVQGDLDPKEVINVKMSKV